MSGFADLVAKQNPTLVVNSRRAPEARSWEFEYEAKDNAGALVSFTGATGTCVVVDDTGQVILELDVTFPSDGRVLITKDEADTVDLTDDQPVRHARWDLVVEKDGDRVQFWSWVDSHFQIYQAVS